MGVCCDQRCRGSAEASAGGCRGPSGLPQGSRYLQVLEPLQAAAVAVRWRLSGVGPWSNVPMGSHQPGGRQGLGVVVAPFMKLASWHCGRGPHPGQAPNRDPAPRSRRQPQELVFHPNLSPLPTLLVGADRLRHRGIQGCSNLVQPLAAHRSQVQEPY